MTREELLRAEFERLRAERKLLEDLIQSPVWALLYSALQATWMARRVDEHSAAASLDGSFARAKALGAVEALEHAMKLPQMLIENRISEEQNCLEQIDILKEDANE